MVNPRVVKISFFFIYFHLLQKEEFKLLQQFWKYLMPLFCGTYSLIMIEELKTCPKVFDEVFFLFLITNEVIIKFPIVVFWLTWWWVVTDNLIAQCYKALCILCSMKWMSGIMEVIKSGNGAKLPQVDFKRSPTATNLCQQINKCL